MNDPLPREEIKSLIRETVTEVLKEIGVGGNIGDMQRDFIFLREQRIGAVAFKKAVKKSLITLAVSAIPGIVWLLWYGLHNQK